MYYSTSIFESFLLFGIERNTIKKKILESNKVVFVFSFGERC